MSPCFPNIQYIFQLIWRSSFRLQRITTSCTVYIFCHLVVYVLIMHILAMWAFFPLWLYYSPCASLSSVQDCPHHVSIKQNRQYSHLQHAPLKTALPLIPLQVPALLPIPRSQPHLQSSSGIQPDPRCGHSDE